jgi:hypothetical protein
MAKINMDLREIKEKGPLTPGVYTFTVRKVGLEKTRAQDADMVAMELVPQESPSDLVFHRYTLKPGILASGDTDKSLKRFLDVLAIPYDADFDTDVLFGLSFRGTVKHEVYNGKTQARIENILGR